MPPPETLDDRILVVQNQRQHNQGSDISSLDDASSPSCDDNERGDRMKATITTGFIVKHHIFPRHKFITSPEDLRFDKTTGGKTICAMYLDKLVMGEEKGEEKCRKLWEHARECIPTSLNTQRNNTSKAIRDITFKSEFNADTPAFPSLPTHISPTSHQQNYLKYSKKRFQ